MIADLKIIDEDTAAGFGQKFDVSRTLEAGIGFLKAFAAEVAPASDEKPSLRFKGDGDRRQPLDEDAYARLRRETRAIARIWDVTNEFVRADIGPFRLRFYPLGREDLQRYGADGTPTLVTEQPWHELDPTPVIDFTPPTGLPFFGPRGLALLKELTMRHAPPGTRPDFSSIPALRFPHYAFGAGFGALRISLLTIPVTP